MQCAADAQLWPKPAVSLCLLGTRAAGSGNKIWLQCPQATASLWGDQAAPSWCLHGLFKFPCRARGRIVVGLVVLIV